MAVGSILLRQLLSLILIPNSFRDRSRVLCSPRGDLAAEATAGHRAGGCPDPGPRRRGRGCAATPWMRLACAWGRWTGRGGAGRGGEGLAARRRLHVGPNYPSCPAATGQPSRLGLSGCLWSSHCTHSSLPRWPSAMTAAAPPESSTNSRSRGLRVFHILARVASYVVPVYLV